MKGPYRPLPTWLASICWIGGGLFLCLQVLGLLYSVPMAWVGTQFIHKEAPKDTLGLLFLMLLSYGPLLANVVGLWIGFIVVRLPGKRLRRAQAQQNPPAEPTAAPQPVKVTSDSIRKKHWHCCNILQLAPDASRLWQFDARGGGFVPGREQSTAIDGTLPARSIEKSWSSLWQPRLNVAWLPPENVFLRVIELPRSTFDETFAMVELQLEKLSPIPVTQIVWTIHVLSHHGKSPQRDGARPAAAAGEPAKAEDLQTVVVVIAERSVVEEFLGKLEGRGYLADRLEVPMLDQLEAVSPEEDGAWIYPVALAGQSAALVAWRSGGTLHNLSFIALPPAGDRPKALKAQLGHLAWAGELEGWLTAPPNRWHLVSDPVNAAEWENALREGLGEPVSVVPPLPPAELAAHTARRAAAAGLRAPFLPAEFSVRYHQQYVDRLWLRGLAATGVLYAIGVVIYFCAVGLLAVQTRQVERQVAGISGSYTNTLQLRARLEVLQQRQELKYAALDCWKIVAEQLPAGIALQRFSFVDGRKLSLNGTSTPDQLNVLYDFDKGMHKAMLNNQPMFNSGEPPLWRQQNNKVTWNYDLQLKRQEGMR
jgi:hypothetical protein